MPDPLTPLFDDLRRRELPRVQAPGPEAARRTEHRRATVRAAAIAAVVVVVGGSWIVAQRGAGSALPPASPHSVVSPSSTEDLWRGRTDKVAIAGRLVPEADHTDVMGQFDHETSLEAGVGVHVLRVGCSGPAPLPFTIFVDDTVHQQDTIVCTDSATGTFRDYEIVLTQPASVRIILSRVGEFDAYALKLMNG